LIVDPKEEELLGLQVGLELEGGFLEWDNAGGERL
jgi:hypothetical protein